MVARIFLLKKNWPWYQFSFGKWKGLQEEGTSVHKVSLFLYKQMSWNGRLCPVHPKSQASASGNLQGAAVPAGLNPCSSHVDKLTS